MAKVPCSQLYGRFADSALGCRQITESLIEEWAENLIPDHAYTTWFAYINDPKQCGDYAGGTLGVCADADAILPADNPPVVFGRMDGAIVGASGRLHFTGEFRDLRFSHGSTVWIIMF